MYKILIKPIYKILIKPNSINQLGWMLYGYSSSEFWQKVLQDEDENGDLFDTEIAKFNLAFKAHLFRSIHSLSLDIVRNHNNN